VLVGFLLVTGRITGIAALGATGWTWIAFTGVLLAGYVGTGWRLSAARPARR
jgi:hypothetical protein